jgi:hypothetical protein
MTLIWLKLYETSKEPELLSLLTFWRRYAVLIDPKHKLDTVHPNLQLLVTLLSDSMDIVVVCGHRGQKDQDAAFKAKRSKLKWPKSKHNGLPSRAVDIAPANERGGIDWNDLEIFKRMQFLARKIAVEQFIELSPILSWDLPHIELKGS